MNKLENFEKKLDEQEEQIKILSKKINRQKWVNLYLLFRE